MGLAVTEGRLRKDKGGDRGWESSIKCRTTALLERRGDSM